MLVFFFFFPSPPLLLVLFLLFLCVGAKVNNPGFYFIFLLDEGNKWDGMGMDGMGWNGALSANVCVVFCCCCVFWLN